MLAEGARAPAAHHVEVVSLREQAGPRSARACRSEGGDATLQRAAGCALRAGALVGVGHFTIAFLGSERIQTNLGSFLFPPPGVTAVTTPLTTPCNTFTWLSRLRGRRNHPYDPPYDPL